MKLSILLSIVFAMITSQSFADKNNVTIDKSGGGPNGYYHVGESHDGNSNALACWNPGYSECVWVTQPYDVIQTPKGTYSVLKDIDPDIQLDISSGKLSGSYTLDDTYIITWKGTDIYNYTLQATLIE